MCMEQLKHSTKTHLVHCRMTSPGGDSYPVVSICGNKLTGSSATLVGLSNITILSNYKIIIYYNYNAVYGSHTAPL